MVLWIKEDLSQRESASCYCTALISLLGAFRVSRKGKNITAIIYVRSREERAVSVVALRLQPFLF